MKSRAWRSEVFKRRAQPLHVDGRDIENPAKLALKWNADAATWTVMGDAEEYRRSETRRKILKALEEADEPLGPKDVAEITDLPENTVRQRLYQMSKDGEVKVEARGRYVPHNVHNNRNNEGANVTEVMDVMDACNDTPSPIYCIHGFPSGENC